MKDHNFSAHGHDRIGIISSQKDNPITEKPNEKEKMKLEFAPIDAKEIGLITITFEAPKNEYNAKLLGQLTAKYLNALLKLQKEISEEFSKSAIDNKYPQNIIDNWDDKGLRDDFIYTKLGNINYDEYKKLIEKAADDLYYT